VYLPTTREELSYLGWDELDVILVSGDVYIDSPYDGIAVIGKMLIKSGYRVGVISQPDISSGRDITRLGEPLLFWGVSGGCVDSMVANYTALKKKRHSDDLTPGGINDRRPDRAVIMYSNLIRQYFKNTRPIVLGGIEASLRRVAHYDYWSDSIRRSILFDAKADYLIYGMGERTVVDLACKLKNNEESSNIPGICHISNTPPENSIELPSFEDVKTDKSAFIRMFDLFYKYSDPDKGKSIFQKYGNRYLIQNEPQPYPNTKQLDEIHELDYEYGVHPFYAAQGAVRAKDTIRFSITTHRGCFGGCNFCSIAVHQGRKIISRTEDSIIREAVRLSRQKDFKGYINDVGGPTANMFGMGCTLDESIKKNCTKVRCIDDKPCSHLDFSHEKLTGLYLKLRKIAGIKKIFIASGLRYDLVVSDRKYGDKYLQDLVEHHVSGQLKIAPEHIVDNVLKLMGKPSNKNLIDFKERFYSITKKIGKPQFLTYYIIAGHPGCDVVEMEQLGRFMTKEMGISPEQVQIFTPTPSTYSTLMYYTGIDPVSGKPVFVEKSDRNKRIQKEIITGKPVQKYSGNRTGTTSKRYK
jgi:uncharacterized radical SAM protein YgiQ